MRWKKIRGTHAEISDTGLLRNAITKRVLSTHIRDGYRCVNGAGCQGRNHNLVARAFLGKTPSGKNIGFRDGNRDNCTVGNLHFVPKVLGRWTATRGRGQVRYSIRKVRRVIALGRRGISVRKIERLTGVCYRTAHRYICDGIGPRQHLRRA